MHAKYVAFFCRMTLWYCGHFQDTFLVVSTFEKMCVLYIHEHYPFTATDALQQMHCNVLCFCCIAPFFFCCNSCTAAHFRYVIPALTVSFAATDALQHTSFAATVVLQHISFAVTVALQHTPFAATVALQHTSFAATVALQHIFCMLYYEVATISRLLKIMGLFCRIWSVL